MFQKLIYRILHKRHYWRDIGFDELSELYSSMLFRSLAISLTGIFIPAYLYKLNYQIYEIFLFFVFMFLFWQLSALVSAWTVSRWGPKHNILFSNVMIVIATAMLTSLDDFHWPLVLIGLFLGSSYGLFFVALNVDFSKVKHNGHSGKEVGWLFVMQRIGLALGPIVGGIVAYFFGPEYIFLIASVLLFGGTIPLFLTGEPVRLNQKVSFSDLKIPKHQLFSFCAHGVENTISSIAWPFFIGVVVFVNNTFLNLGIVTSVAVVVAFVATRSIGSVIDKHQGRKLLRIGASLNSVLHIFRVFVGTFPTVLLVNIVNEAVTPMYRMPYFKGFFDAADDYPRHRIAYISVMESVSAFARTALFALFAVLSLFIDNLHMLFGLIFICGSLASLLIMTERYRALR